MWLKHFIKTHDVVLIQEQYCSCENFHLYIHVQAIASWATLNVRENQIFILESLLLLPPRQLPVKTLTLFIVLAALYASRQLSWTCLEYLRALQCPTRCSQRIGRAANYRTVAEWLPDWSTRMADRSQRIRGLLYANEFSYRTEIWRVTHYARTESVIELTLYDSMETDCYT